VSSVKRARLAAVILAAFLVSSAALELSFRHLAHAELWWQSLPTFDFFYGFLGCGLIVLGSKWLGKKLLQRDEDYYS